MEEEERNAARAAIYKLYTESMCKYLQCVDCFFFHPCRVAAEADTAANSICFSIPVVEETYQNGNSNNVDGDEKRRQR